MDLKTELRYKGYVATPLLWNGNLVSQFPQIEFSNNSKNRDGFEPINNKRLGKLVEEFVFYQLKQDPTITWITDNLQIQNEKLTIGEIDALYYQNDEPIHLEIVYKFYLYDTLKTYHNSLAYWIGSNRKDSLIYKLDKLHNKQFPLLHNSITESYVKAFNVDYKTIKQKLCFKAQLFLPHGYTSININPLNTDGIKGFYLSYNKIKILQEYEFYIPEKLDWLISPHLNVDWLSYSLAIEIIKDETNKKRSPLIWLRKNDNSLQTYFITFW